MFLDLAIALSRIARLRVCADLTNQLPVHTEALLHVVAGFQCLDLREARIGHLAELDRHHIAPQLDVLPGFLSGSLPAIEHCANPRSPGCLQA